MFASAPGQTFLIGVFVDEMLRDTGLSRTTFSALYAAATVVSATLTLTLGRVADRIGLRPVWIVTAVGLAVGCLVQSLAEGLLLAALGLALLRSFGQGGFPLLGTLVVNHAFAARRGAAMAIATFGITAAIVVLPPLVALLVDAVGWRDAYRLIAVAVLVVMLPLALLVRGRPGREPGPRVRGLRLALPGRAAAVLLAVLATPALVTTALTFHAISLLAGDGLSTPAAAAALSLLGAAGAVALVVTGAIADRVGTRALLCALTGLLGAGTALFLLPGAAASFAGFAVIGLSTGVWGVVGGIAWARTYGLDELGRLQGLSFAAQIVAAAAGPLPLALSLGATGSYTAGLLFLLAAALAAAAAAARWHPSPTEPSRPA
jgi:predicted MFS family arabinose efflux permease